MSGPDHVKRLCIFAHFDKDNIVDQYVLFYLQDIRKVADRVVFVSTSSLTAETISALKHICDAVIIRKNEGYDFASWKSALKSETLDDFDELLLCNDSVYGPLFPLEQVFYEMKGKACDFWGMTSNYDIAYHVQSYFLVFRKAVLVSSAFQQFWEGLETQQSKKGVIELGEIRLSQTLLKAGFRDSTYTRHRLLLGLAIFYCFHFYLAKTGIRMRKYIRVLWLRLFRSHGKDHRRRSLAALIKRAILSAFYNFQFHLAKTGSRIRKYIQVIWLRMFRKHRNDRLRSLAVLIKRVILSAGSIFSEMKALMGNGFLKMFNFIRHPGEKLRYLGLLFEVRIKAVNVTHFLWKQLVLYCKMPFIKVDLLRDNPMGVNIQDYATVVSRVSNYNVPLIADHLSRARKRSEEV